MNPIVPAATTLSRAAALLLWVCAVVMVSACEKTPAQNIAAPTPSLTPTTGLTIGSLPSPLTVGQSVQLTAMVVLPDGATKLTDDAVWKSSDASVMTISSSGVLSVVAHGSADITATAYQHAASVHLRVLFAITGIVHESVPTETQPVQGARVVIQGGLDSGTSAMTDGAGRFSLEAEAAGFTLAVSKDGYDSTSAKIAELPRDQRPEITLVPDAVPVTSRLTGKLCADDAFWQTVYPSLYKCEGSPLIGHHFIAMHRAGVVELNMSWVYKEDYSLEFMWLEVRCGALIVEQEYLLLDYLQEYYPGVAPATRIHNYGSPNSTNTFDFEQGPLRVSIPSPSLCEIKPGRYSSFKGVGVSTNYQMDVTHPK
jgi:hypothetical protein